METSTTFDPDSVAAKDAFHRKSFAARLARVIMYQPRGECLVVSISSEWGAGKSSVLQWMRSVWSEGKENADQTACIPITDFNPWGVTGAQDLLFRLYEKLVKAIDPNDQLLTTWQKLKQSAGMLGRAGKAVGAVASAAQEKIAGSVIEGASGLFETLCRVGIKEVREQVEKKLLSSPWRLVVILDDIDRLEREELLILLRILKREAALPNTTYVLAMDEEQVAKVIGGSGINDEALGRKYLEKIIQVRLQLPSVPPHSMKKFVMAEIHAALPKGQTLDLDRFSAVFDGLFLHRVQTPRTAKTLANAIRFTVGMLPDEVDTTDLALLETARLLFPELYVRIRGGVPYLKLGITQVLRSLRSDEKDKTPPYWDWIKKAWSDAEIADPGDEERQAMASWMPQVNRASHVEDYELAWWRAKRLCSAKYHWRYFAQAIVSGDVADSEIEKLKRLCVDHHSNAEYELNQALSDDHADIVWEKLVRMPYTGDEAAKMTIFLSGVSIDGHDTASRAAQICYTIPDAEKIEAIAASVAELAPIKWVGQFFSNLPSDRFAQKPQQQGGKPCSPLVRLAERQLESLQHGLEADTEAIIDEIWGIWHFGASKKLKSILAKRLSDDPNFALVLLASVCGRGVGREPPKIWHWNGLDSIKSLERVLSISDLQKALVAGGLSPAKKPSSSGDRMPYCTPEELVFYFEDTLAHMRVEQTP